MTDIMNDPEDLIGYAALIEGAMRGVVRDVLYIISQEGLPGDHHCYITFDTRAEGVDIPESLHAQYPDEMTIVLQHQFWNLHVEEEFFSIELSFNRERQKLVVPFVALTSFADPSIKFGLQFHRRHDDDLDGDAPPPPPGLSSSGKEKGDGESAEVISLDTFRKKDS